VGFGWKLDLSASALHCVSVAELGLRKNYLIPLESEEPDFLKTVLYLRPRICM
jgi:hypothetical protein